MILVVLHVHTQYVISLCVLIILYNMAAQLWLGILRLSSHTNIKVSIHQKFDHIDVFTHGLTDYLFNNDLNT